jgi:hypothetical protein
MIDLGLVIVRIHVAQFLVTARVPDIDVKDGERAHQPYHYISTAVSDHRRSFESQMFGLTRYCDH